VGGQLVAFTSEVGIFNPDFSRVTLSQRERPLRTPIAACGSPLHDFPVSKLT
jgi:hypothetical protein